MKLKIGCCGFPVGKKRYFQTLSLMEVQKSFYGTLSLQTALRWREEAPSEFEFTLKASQLITHPAKSPTYRRYPGEVKEGEVGFFRPTETVFRAFEESKSLARALQARLILFQTPPSFTPIPENFSNLEKFFKRIDREEFILVWEPRGDWEEEEVRSICSEYDLIHCVDPFLSHPVWGEVLYLRLHGGRGYKHKYSDGELREVLEWVREVAKKTYLLFNNVHMWEDAKRCQEIRQEMVDGEREND